jgi:hypothetical protein
VGLNVPKIERVRTLVIYSFGVGQMIRFGDDAAAKRAAHYGWKIHNLGARPWALKILRWSV